MLEDEKRGKLMFILLDVCLRCLLREYSWYFLKHLVSNYAVSVMRILLYHGLISLVHLNKCFNRLVPKIWWPHSRRSLIWKLYSICWYALSFMSQLAARDDVLAILHATLFIYLLNFIKKKPYAGWAILLVC